MRLVPHPGLDHKYWDGISSKVNAKNADDLLPQINDKMDSLIKGNADQNAVVLAYRAHLFSMLPASPAAFDLGMQDALDRAQHGLKADAIMGALSAGIVEWASDAKPPELKAMIEQLQRFSAMAKNVPGAYTKLAKGDKGGYSWGAGTKGLDSGSIDKLVETLHKDITNPATPLGFKKDE
jgi:hypothetical protein